MGQTWLIRPTLGANLTLPGVGQCSRFGLGQVDACCKLVAMMSGPVTPWCPAQLLKLGTHLPWSSSSSPRHAPNRNPRSAHWEPCHTGVVFTPRNSRNQQLSRSPSTGQGKQTAGAFTLGKHGALWANSAATCCGMDESAWLKAEEGSESEHPHCETHCHRTCLDTNI